MTNIDTAQQQKKKKNGYAEKVMIILQRGGMKS